MPNVRMPLATYRLQFQPDFGFDQARAVVEYLDRLGVSDVYASPFLQARPGSVHGYDVVDHSRINSELGGEESFRSFSDALREKGLGLLMDVVPNHMAVAGGDNAWWRDVLENGPSSLFAGFFDIDWRPPKSDLRQRVLLPILGDQFGKIIENGELTLAYGNGAFHVRYHEHHFPLDPHTTTGMLEEASEHVRTTSSPADEDCIELQSIVTALRHLPPRSADEDRELDERQREKEVARRRLSQLVSSSETVRRAIDGVLAEWRGEVGQPHSYDRLESLLRNQAYRLAHWRVAADEINYRRFFDVNHLAAIRVEDPQVFACVHEVVLRLIQEGRVTGLRIDHPDGLYDPEGYFRTLQNESRRALPAPAAGSTSLPISGIDCAIYVIAEKILGEHEPLPQDWAVHGTTGYEMLNLINGLFVDPDAKPRLYQFYERLTGRGLDFEELVYECKRLILKVSMSSELHVLARRLDRLSEQHRWSRDFTLPSLHDALREVIASFPVYRTYVQHDTSEVQEDDRRWVVSAVRAARRRNPSVDRSVFDFIQSVLLLEEPHELDDAQRETRRDFVLKTQQLTGPVMAKGLEDTTFYRVYPLASLNEVGGEPGAFGVSLDEFHQKNTIRCARRPFSMTASSTHDTKRSEDVRAWLNVLSEIPEEWIGCVQRWQEWNASRKPLLDDEPLPDANEEYLLYQTILGTWPLDPPDDAQLAAYTDRIARYMEKALREAKVHTSWVNPDEEYERGVERFVRAILVRDDAHPFLDDLARMRARIDPFGLVNALSQTLLKIALPGVPDFYQGTELWSFQLVDPDNRGVVDFAQRDEMLRTLHRRADEALGPLCEETLAEWRDGRIKLLTVLRALQFRRRSPDLFLQGSYTPAIAEGVAADHVCSFARIHGESACWVIVPRLSMKLTGGERLPMGRDVWGETRLEVPRAISNTWRDVLTGDTVTSHPSGDRLVVHVGDALRRLPIALLAAER